MFTYTIETPDIEIEYEVTNSSFDYEYGTYVTSGFELRSVMVYVPALNDWMDVMHLEQFCLLADKLVEAKLAEAA